MTTQVSPDVKKRLEALYSIARKLLAILKSIQDSGDDESSRFEDGVGAFIAKAGDLGLPVKPGMMINPKPEAELIATAFELGISMKYTLDKRTSRRQIDIDHLRAEFKRLRLNYESEWRLILLDEVLKRDIRSLVEGVVECERRYLANLSIEDPRDQIAKALKRLSSKLRPSKTKSEDERLDKAEEMVIQGSLALRAVAEIVGIPRETIRRKLKSRLKEAKGAERTFRSRKH